MDEGPQTPEDMPPEQEDSVEVSQIPEEAADSKDSKSASSKSSSSSSDGPRRAVGAEHSTTGESSGLSDDDSQGQPAFPEDDEYRRLQKAKHKAVGVTQAL